MTEKSASHLSEWARGLIVGLAWGVLFALMLLDLSSRGWGGVVGSLDRAPYPASLGPPDSIRVYTGSESGGFFVVCKSKIEIGLPSYAIE
jgi:hypothetical protein